MTIGLIENRIRPSPSPSTDYYVSLFKFLSSSAAQMQGIELLAHHTGTTGKGMNYSDEQFPVGENSMALFRFAQATPPFYVLLQFASGSSFGGTAFGFNSNLTASLYGNGTDASGNPITVTGGFATNNGGVGIAVACLADGGNPWNGTTSPGYAIKGNPVWVSGSNTGSLLVWPRSNGQSGSFDPVTSGSLSGTLPVRSRRHNMIGLVSHGAMNGLHSMMSVVADRSNLLIQTDVGSTGNSTFFFFGQYVPRPGLNPDVPYVCLASTGNGSNPPFAIRPSRFGSLTGIAEEGGVAHPSASFGVRRCSLDYLRTFAQTAQLHPNTMFTYPHKFDQFVYFLLLDEDPNQYGYLGTIEFFRLVFGTVPRATSLSRNFAIFGSSVPQTLKLLVPWDSNSPAGVGAGRLGKLF